MQVYRPSVSAAFMLVKSTEAIWFPNTGSTLFGWFHYWPITADVKFLIKELIIYWPGKNYAALLNTVFAQWFWNLLAMSLCDDRCSLKERDSVFDFSQHWKKKLSQ